MFDKKELGKVINEAKGNKSINRYAQESGVSAAYISKLIRGLYPTAPSPSILKKLADSSVTVSYGELMAAAGHILSLEESDKILAKMAYLNSDNELYKAQNPNLEEKYEILTVEEKNEIDDFKRSASSQDILDFSQSLAMMGYKDLEVLEQGAQDAGNMYNKYPLYPAISAGVPVEIDGITEKEVEKISIPDYLMGKWAGNSDIYFTKTNGDSMNIIMPHDTLIAVKSIELYDLKDNDIVVYRKNGEYAVKRFFKDGDRLIFKPDSTDNRFTDDVINVNDMDDLTISGKVVMWNVVVD